MPDNISELSAIAIICLFLIKEGFAYLKTKKINGKNGHINDVLLELKLINANHLHSIENTIKTGDKDIVSAINSGNQKIVELLGRIDGRLER